MVDGAIFPATREGGRAERGVRAAEHLGFGATTHTGCSNLRVYRRHTGQLTLARVVVLRVSLLATWNRPIKVTWQGVERLVSSFMPHTCHPSYAVFPSSVCVAFPCSPLQPTFILRDVLQKLVTLFATTKI